MFEATFGPIDEDGYQGVTITGPDDSEASYVLRYDMAHQWVDQEIGILSAMADGHTAICQHGLSAALCQGPNHY